MTSDRAARDAQELRERAQERLREVRPGTQAPVPADAQPIRLLHELQVYQVELELQNEQLEAARAWIEAALASYTELYDFAPVPYFTLDRGGVVQESNLAGAKLLGTERARLHERRFAQFVAEPERRTFNAFLKDVFGQRRLADIELPLVAGDGTVRVVRLDATLSGKGEHCNVVVHDVSARVAREQRTALAARSFGEARQAMYITDAHGLIAEVNAAFCRVTGFTDAQVLGKHASQLRSDAAQPCFDGAMLGALATEDGWSGQARNRRPDGTPYPVFEQVSALLDVAGAIEYYVVRFDPV
jgi:PAS domain S-box-containing protein